MGDLTGETALTRAADCGDRLIVGIILQQGSCESQRLLVQRARSGPQGDSATALHLAAAANGCVDIYRDLLDAVADPNALDRQNHTALLNAARGQHVETVALLVTCAADVSVCVRGSDTPLHVAASHGGLPMADLLVRLGA